MERGRKYKIGLKVGMSLDKSTEPETGDKTLFSEIKYKDNLCIIDNRCWQHLKNVAHVSM